MRKKLTKSSTNVVISGSLAGIAEFIGIDATIVRVIYVILSLCTAAFPGFFLYIVLMIIIPSANRRHNRPYDSYDSSYGYEKKSKTRREVEKLDPEEDDWSDF